MNSIIIVDGTPLVRSILALHEKSEYFCKVKRSLAILLLSLYLVTGIGATIHFHYCMGDFVKWSLIPSEGSSCDHCGMACDAKDGCCKNEVKILKSTVDQNFQQTQFNPTFFETAFLTTYLFDQSSDVYLDLCLAELDAPYLKWQIPLFIANKVIRI